MLDLVDRAFGGLGTVAAPTHEQEYGIDSTLRDRAIAAETARIRAEVEAANPEPDAIDPALTGRARREAQQARTSALGARRRAIAAEMRRRSSEITRAGELAMTYEGFSGPMFQHRRHGEVHRGGAAPAGRRAVPAPQRRPARVARAPPRRSRPAPGGDPAAPGHLPADRTAARPARAVRVQPHRAGRPGRGDARLRLDAAANRLTPTDFDIERRPAGADGFTTHAVLTGEVRRRGRDPQEMTFTFDSAADSPIPTDASMMGPGPRPRGQPEKFAWRMDTVHRNDGTTRRTVIAERVISYLHHGSLDVSAHEHFTRPEPTGVLRRSTFQPAPAGRRRPAPAPGRPARVP